MEVFIIAIFISSMSGAQVRLDFADSLIRFAPENQLDHLHDTPLLVVHGEINELHPVAEPMSLLAKYPGSALHYTYPQISTDHVVYI